jgi:hypothetical protein
MLSKARGSISSFFRLRKGGGYLDCLQMTKVGCRIVFGIQCWRAGRIQFPADVFNIPV